MQRHDIGCPVACVGGNQITNGTAETGDTTGWTAVGWTATNADKNGGTYSFTARWDARTLTQTVDMPLLCLSSTFLSGWYSFYIKTAGADQIRIRITYSNGYVRSDLYDSVGVWQNFNYEFAAGDIGNGYVKKTDSVVSVEFMKYGDAGDAYLDDIHIQTCDTSKPASNTPFKQSLANMEKTSPPNLTEALRLAELADPPDMAESLKLLEKGSPPSFAEALKEMEKVTISLNTFTPDCAVPGLGNYWSRTKEVIRELEK